MYNLNIASDVIVESNNDTKDYLINLFVTLGCCFAFILSSVILFKNRINNGK